MGGGGGSARGSSGFPGLCQTCVAGSRTCGGLARSKPVSSFWRSRNTQSHFGVRFSAAELAFSPTTDDLYTVVQERDGLGDRLVPDFMARVQQGAFYGWPYAYIGQHPQPGFAQLRPDKVKLGAA